MPHGILTRKPHTGFRSGEWMTKNSEHLTVQFAESWDLAEATTGFPMVSGVVFGQRADAATKMPTTVLRWIGYLARADSPWSQAKAKLRTEKGTIVALDTDSTMPTSPYKSKFRQGAVLAPRMTLFVTEAAAGPLGSGAGRVAVESMRSNQEKEPWKSVDTIQARVEKNFVRSIYLGETVAPYRTLNPRTAVLPINSTGTAILTSTEIDGQLGLNTWWDTAESVWGRWKSQSDSSRLLDRIDFHGQLTAQLPIAPVRVAYTKAGNTLAAAIIRDHEAIIDHKLYWSPASSEAESHYLCAVLNSKTVLDRVKPLQALGLFKGRDWDKNVFAAPFPIYDNTNDLHLSLSGLGCRAEELAAGVDVSSANTFQAARKIVVAALEADGVADDIESAVAKLIPAVV